MTMTHSIGRAVTTRLVPVLAVALAGTVTAACSGMGVAGIIAAGKMCAAAFSAQAGSVAACGR